MVATKRSPVDMIELVRCELFVVLWYTEFVGWIVCGDKCVEKTVESAPAYETNVAGFHRPFRSP
jgi:hypothetical protein